MNQDSTSSVELVTDVVYVATLVPRTPRKYSSRPIATSLSARELGNLVSQFSYSDWETIYDYLVIERVPLNRSWPKCEIVDWYKYDGQEDRYEVLMPGEWPSEFAYICNWAIG